MKTRNRLFPLLLTGVLLMGQCPVSAEEATEGADLESLEPADYLIENALDYVQTGTYTGLAVDKTIYPVTDEDVQNQISENLYDFTYAQEVTDRPAASGDILTVDITTTIDGKTDTMEDFEVDLGYEVLGESFDENLTDAQVGDTVMFQESFDEDDYMSDWAGKTVDFEVTLKKISASVTPELTEDFVKENTEYETVEDYTASVRRAVEDQYAQQAEDEMAASVISAGMENAAFTGYPQELYDQVYQDNLSSYEELAEMFGMTVEELYEAYDLSEDDLKDETEETIQRQLYISAIALQEDLTVTPEDLLEIAQRYYTEAGYETAEEMLSGYGAKALAPTALEAKVSARLLESAVITEIPYEESADLLDYDEDWDEDDADWDEDDEDWDEDDEDWDEDDEDWDEDDEDWDEDDEDWDEDDTVVYFDEDEN